MSTRKKKHKETSTPPRPRKTHSRQRQRLIDACISALHMYGPSRTTVEKVVAIAKMSPGIVRFYFNSKAAMLVASLQFLAAEFEEQLLVPVAKLKSTPVAALELMVSLYLDPDIASPRKVSVWYAFWGEASSRQEYYDICGQKDESFAALVRDLVKRLIVETNQPHLDEDGIALGLIGALEMLWQDFAFRTERSIDRVAAKRRCMAYLRSVFPGRFHGDDNSAVPAAIGRLPAWAYADAQIHAAERERLFQDAWTAVGHESQIPRTGDFLTLDTGTERVLVVRAAAGGLHALRNNCPESPHTLVTGRNGRFDSIIECKLHGLRFSLDGKRLGPGRADLAALDLAPMGGLLFARAAGREWPTDNPRLPPVWFDSGSPPELRSAGAAVEIPVAADWKVLVEQWLEMSAQGDGVQATTAQGAAVKAGDVGIRLAESWVWKVAAAGGAGFSARRYRKLMNCTAQQIWRRQYLAPNQLLETRPDGVSVLQAVPLAPGRCLARRMDYSALPPSDGARAVLHAAQRLGAYTRRATLDVAQSIQEGMVEFGYQVAAGSAGSPAVACFRSQLAARIPALAHQQPPTER